MKLRKNKSNGLQLKCSDYLINNPRLYVLKAKRKKISLIKVEAENSTRDIVKIQLKESELKNENATIKIQPPERLIKELSEFTWDFLLYTILDTNIWLGLIDFSIFLFGPFYNKRIKNQLKLLSNEEMVLKAGEKRIAIIGFRGQCLPETKIKLVFLNHNQEKFEMDLAVDA